MNNRKKRAFPIMVKVIIITLLILGMMFCSIVMLLIKMEEKQKNEDEQMRIRKAEIVKRAEIYLENKYGKKFTVNPDGFNDAESFIPGMVENKYKLCYEASALDDPDYIFRVYIDIDKNNNQYREQLRDNYCWMFFRDKLRSKIENNVGLTPENYKINLRLYPDVTFSNDITPYSTIKEYFKNSDNRLTVVVYIFTYKDDIETEKEIENKLKKLFDDLRGDSDLSRIYCKYYVTENKSDFDYLDISREEIFNLWISENNPDKSYKLIADTEIVKKFQIISDREESN